MKFVSLHIKAFGGVRDLDYTFRDGINEILLPNGAGKSTLAAFIKMMLYGLERTGLSLTANEFALYEPWQGGRFGGSLTLRHGERTYRITRFYERTGKAKTPQETEYSVIDEGTGEPTDRLGHEPGRTILGVDGESFLRTVYLSCRGITAGKTADISAKLGGVEAEEDDMAAVTRALKLLRDKRTEIRTYTKQKNGRKLLDVAELRLADLRARITEARAALSAGAEAEGQAAAAKERLKAAETRLAQLHERRAAIARRRGEESEAARRREELTLRITEGEEAVRRLGTHFESGAPTVELLSSLEADAAEYRTRLSGRTAAPHDEMRPDEETLAAMRRAVRHRDETAKKANEAPSVPTAQGGHAIGLFGGIGAFLAVLGILLLILLSPVAGGVLLALGAVALAAALLLYRRAAAASRVAAAAQEAQRERRLEAEEAKEEAVRLLAPFGLTAEADESELDALRERAVAHRLAEAAHRQNEERLLVLLTGLNEALAPYRILPEATDPTVRVRALRAAHAEWQTAKEGLLSLRAELSRLPASPSAEDTAADEGALEEAIAAAKTEADSSRAATTKAEVTARQFRELGDTLPPLLGEEERLAEEVEALHRRMALLDKTADLLADARDAYEESYLGAIREHLATYTDRLLGGRLGTPQVDLSLGLSFLSDGEAHEAAYFSTGLRAIIDVCLRLALTDALYAGDPPPLLLDDPFVALDEENLRTARSLLTELGKERQLVYLTCHAARSLEE